MKFYVEIWAKMAEVSSRTLTFLWLFFYFDISDFVRDESFTIR